MAAHLGKRQLSALGGGSDDAAVQPGCGGGLKRPAVAAQAVSGQPPTAHRQLSAGSNAPPAAGPDGMMPTILVGLPEQAVQQDQEERPQNGAAPPSPQTAVPAQPPPKLRPRPFSKKSFYGGNPLLRCTGVPPMTTREIYMEERIQRFQINAKQREQHWKEAEAAEAAGRPPPAPPETFSFFPTQQPAFEFADSQSGLNVFSVEYNSEGKRRFIVGSRACFWKRYSNYTKEARHHYEIIRQGFPCHLYFDLEFQRADNPGLDGTAATDALVELVGEQLRGSFQLELQHRWVLELDSSTDTKFSRHLVIRIPGAAFASNAHVGAFVLQLCAAAKERRETDARAALLIVKKGEEETLFVDPAVYSRNRAFRLYLSSKFGKPAILDKTDRFGGAALTTQQEIFEASLITAVPPGPRLLRCFEETAEEAAVSAARARLQSRPRGAAPQGGRQAPPCGGGYSVNYGPCPYPGLEQFINTICCEGGVQGRVRSWVPLDDLLILNIKDNRFCGNIGRAHKSNGIFYVVDLKEGAWYQRCYDPDCRNYRSPLMPLPAHLQGLWREPGEPEAATAVGRGKLLSHLEGSRLSYGATSASVSGSAPAMGTACSSCCAAGASCHCAEVDEDSLYMEAVEQYEQQQQVAQQQVAQQREGSRTQQHQQAQQQDGRPAQQAQQQDGRPAQQAQQQDGRPAPKQLHAAEGAATAPGGGTADDDPLLLQALMQYKQQAGSTLATSGQQWQQLGAGAEGSTAVAAAGAAADTAAAVTAAARAQALRSLFMRERPFQMPLQAASVTQRGQRQQQKPQQAQQARPLEIWEKFL